MKIRDIYLIKSSNIVSVSIAVLCIMVTIISMVFPDVYQSIAYAYPLKYPWQICSGIFLHGSPELSMAGTIGHLCFNLLLVLPFGIMLEKILGSKRFALMSVILWIVNAITFYTIAVIQTPEGENAYGAGISGIAFSYGMLGLYVLFLMAKSNVKKLLRQVSFYLLMNVIVVMLIMVNPYVAGISSMFIHLVAILSGITFAILYHKDIKHFFE